MCTWPKFIHRVPWHRKDLNPASTVVARHSKHYIILVLIHKRKISTPRASHSMQNLKPVPWTALQDWTAALKPGWALAPLLLYPICFSPCSRTDNTVVTTGRRKERLPQKHFYLFYKRQQSSLPQLGTIRLFRNKTAQQDQSLSTVSQLPLKACLRPNL